MKKIINRILNWLEWHIIKKHSPSKTMLNDQDEITQLFIDGINKGLYTDGELLKYAREELAKKKEHEQS